MLLSLAHKPSEETTEVCVQAMGKFKALAEVFIPSVRLLFSSLFSAMISQLFCIFILEKLQRFRFCNKPIAMFLAGVVDNATFTFFAFYFFSSITPDFKFFLENCMAGAFIIRIITIFACTIASFSKLFRGEVNKWSRS
jgi:uncharacterized PurR-regulated membrane protein YhhQ (DUF165 family)